MVGVLCCIVKGRVTAASVTVTTLHNIRHDLDIFIICIMNEFHAERYYWQVRHPALVWIVPSYSLVLVLSI